MGLSKFLNEEDNPPLGAFIQLRLLVIAAVLTARRAGAELVARVAHIALAGDSAVISRVADALASLLPKTLRPIQVAREARPRTRPR